MKNICLYVIAAITLLVTASCERRELSYDYSPYCDVRVNLGWAI